jgi:hypothetical protein
MAKNKKNKTRTAKEKLGYKKGNECGVTPKKKKMKK